MTGRITVREAPGSAVKLSRPGQRGETPDEDRPNRKSRLYTFHGPMLLPRDAELQARMRSVSPVITRETTMWKAWVGFNASHSFGAILFGLVYGCLALVHPAFVFESVFLPVVGLVLLAGYAFLGARYWFSVPFRGILLSLILYVLALILAGA
jgi:hypothetical protein